MLVDLRSRRACTRMLIPIFLCAVVSLALYVTRDGRNADSVNIVVKADPNGEWSMNSQGEILLQVRFTKRAGMPNEWNTLSQGRVLKLSANAWNPDDQIHVKAASSTGDDVVSIGGPFCTGSGLQEQFRIGSFVAVEGAAYLFCTWSYIAKDGHMEEIYLYGRFANNQRNQVGAAPSKRGQKETKTSPE